MSVLGLASPTEDQQEYRERAFATLAIIFPIAKQHLVPLAACVDQQLLLRLHLHAREGARQSLPCQVVVQDEAGAAVLLYPHDDVTPKNQEDCAKRVFAIPEVERPLSRCRTPRV